jgi:hypothetical protein
MDRVFEVAAALLQFGVLPESHTSHISEGTPSYGRLYYEEYFQKPLDEFAGSFEKAFSFYNFCAWFCQTANEIESVRTKFLDAQDPKKVVSDLLADKTFQDRKDLETSRDEKYSVHCSDHYEPVPSTLVVDLPQVLSRIAHYRSSFFENTTRIASLLTDIDEHQKWLKKEAPRVPFLVDFGRELGLDEEISDNYEPSRWVLPKARFLYYNDHLGQEILTQFEVDMLTWLQHLSRFVVSPTIAVPFGSIFTNKEFLGFEFIDERPRNLVVKEDGNSHGLTWQLEMH